ncbi:STYKc [Aspergillus sp. HF37]|nr:STYKc [Aspergillus sp. HF37]
MDIGFLLANNPILQPEVFYITKGEFVHWGATAVVERLPSGAIIKSPVLGGSPAEMDIGRRKMQVELHVYRRIHEDYPDHPRIPKIIHWYPATCCLSMEFLENGNLAEFMERTPDCDISLDLRLRWAKHAAEALQVLHSLHIIHCDVVPRNFLVDSELNLKICDLGGGSMNGIAPLAMADVRYLPPNYDMTARPLLSDDLFSIGSLIYFIMTGKHPYEGRRKEWVQHLYDTGRFPDTANVICGDVIKKCWNNEFETAQAIYDALPFRPNASCMPQLVAETA